MESQPLISLIIPAYNVSAYLPTCLDSAIGQDYAHLEIILIDDGSTDSSAEIIDRYAARDTRIRAVHQANAGVMRVRQRAIEMAQGEYLSFLDGDDYLPTNAISTLYDSIVRQGTDLVCADIVRVGRDYAIARPEKWDGVIDGDTFMRYQLTNRMEGYLVAKLYKRTLFDGLTYPADISLAEDKFINIQIAAKKPRVGHIAYTAYYYVKRQDSVSHRVVPIEYGIAYTQRVEDFLRQKGCYEAYEAELTLLRIRFYLMHIGHTSNPSIAHLPFTHTVYAQLQRPEVMQLVQDELERGQWAVIRLYKHRSTVWLGKMLTTWLRIRQSILKRIHGSGRSD